MKNLHIKRISESFSADPIYHKKQLYAPCCDLNEYFPPTYMFNIVLRHRQVTTVVDVVKSFTQLFSCIIAKTSLSVTLPLILLKFSKYTMS